MRPISLEAINSSLVCTPPVPRRFSLSPDGRRTSRPAANPPPAPSTNRYFVRNTISPRPLADPDRLKVFVDEPLPSKLWISGLLNVAMRSIVDVMVGVRLMCTIGTTTPTSQRLVRPYVTNGATMSFFSDNDRDSCRRSPSKKGSSGPFTPLGGTQQSLCCRTYES